MYDSTLLKQCILIVLLAEFKTKISIAAHFSGHTCRWHNSYASCTTMYSDFYVILELILLNTRPSNIKGAPKHRTNTHKSKYINMNP